MPEIKSHPAAEVKEFNKARLSQLANDVILQMHSSNTVRNPESGTTAENLKTAFEHEMNW